MVVFVFWNLYLYVYMYVFFVFIQYKEYEQVVVEDRIEKEKARRKADQEAIELKASIRVSIEGIIF